MRRTLPILSLIVLSLLFTACGDFFVSENSVDRITLSTTGILLSSAETTNITASAVTVAGTSTDVTSSATWTSSNQAVATVDNAGKVTAVGQGTATITASSGGESATATVIVAASPFSTAQISPSSFNLGTTRLTQQLIAQARLQNGTTIDVTPIATWTSDNSSVATVSSSGLVTFNSSGTTLTTTAKITATFTTSSGQQSGTSTANISLI